MADNSSEHASAGHWKIVLGLAPAVVLWAVLVGWLAFLLYGQTSWWGKADEANLREWLDEYRNFRKSLPEMVRDYAADHRRLRAASPNGTASEMLQDRALEIREQLAAMAD